MFNHPSLRAILLVDGLVSGAASVLLLAGAGILDSALDLPAAFLRGVGVALLPWCVLLGLIATRRVIGRRAVQAVIAVNLGWVAASLVLPFTGWVEPNALGIAFILIQALAVTGFALVQIAKLAGTEPAPRVRDARSFQV